MKLSAVYDRKIRNSKVIVRRLIKTTNLNIFSIQVKPMVFIIKDLSRVFVPCIASHIISQHQNNSFIRYAQPFYSSACKTQIIFHKTVKYL